MQMNSLFFLANLRRSNQKPKFTIHHYEGTLCINEFYLYLEDTWWKIKDSFMGFYGHAMIILCLDDI